MTSKIQRDAFRAGAVWSYLTPRLNGRPLRLHSVPRSHHAIMGLMRHEMNRAGLAMDAAREALEDAPDFLKEMEQNSQDQEEGEEGGDYNLSPAEVLELLNSAMGAWNPEEKQQFVAHAKAMFNNGGGNGNGNGNPTVTDRRTAKDFPLPTNGSPRPGGKLAQDSAFFQRFPSLKDINIAGGDSRGILRPAR